MQDARRRRALLKEQKSPKTKNKDCESKQGEANECVAKGAKGFHAGRAVGRRGHNRGFGGHRLANVQQLLDQIKIHRGRAGGRSDQDVCVRLRQRRELCRQQRHRVRASLIGHAPTAGAASLSVAPSLYAWYDAQSAYFAAYYAENTAAAVIVDPAQPNNYCVAYNGSGVCAPARCTPCAATIPAATIGPQYVAPATPGSPATPGASLPCVGPAGCSPPTKYVAQASANSVGIITAVAQTTSGLNAETFVLVPQLSGGRVDWSASGTCKTRAGGALC